MNTPVDITGVVLKTRRLILRPWKASDLEDFFTYASVDGVGQLAGWVPHRSIEESRAILERFIQGKKTFALEYQGKVIGSLGVEKYDEESLPELASLQGRELGYVLSKDYWGQGFMPEAVKAVMAYLFETCHLDFLTVGHFERNTQSRRVIEKCGFHFLRCRTYETRYGTVEPDREYILYRTEWKK